MAAAWGSAPSAEQRGSRTAAAAVPHPYSAGLRPPPPASALVGAGFHSGTAKRRKRRLLGSDAVQATSSPWYRRASEAAVPSEDPVGSLCEDKPGVFLPMTGCSGSECVGGVDYLAVLVGGANVACQMTMQQLFEVYQRNPWWTAPLPSSNLYLFELCPATCAKVGVGSVGCGASPPPIPPLAPSPPPTPLLGPGPSGFVTVATASEIREHINRAPAHGSLLLYIPSGATLPVGGSPITISQVDLVLTSDGEGATLDAQQLSRVFVVQRGARLTLRAIVLANGHTQTHGGTFQVANANVTMSSCHIVNSTAELDAGAVHIGFGNIILTDGSSIINANSLLLGGAILCVWSSVKITRQSLLVNSAALQGGGIFVFRGTIALTESSSIVNSRASDGGALYVRGSSLLVDEATIMGSTATKLGGALAVFGGRVTLTEPAQSSTQPHHGAGQWSF